MGIYSGCETGWGERAGHSLPPFHERLIVGTTLSEQLNAKPSLARFWRDVVLKGRSMQQEPSNHAFQQQPPRRFPGMPTAESSPKQSLAALLSRLSLTDNTGALRSLSGKRASFLLQKLHALAFQPSSHAVAVHTVLLQRPLVRPLSPVYSHFTPMVPASRCSPAA